MLCAFMDRVWSIKELCILRIIVALSTGLVDGGHDILWSAMMKLPSFGAL